MDSMIWASFDAELAILCLLRCYIIHMMVSRMGMISESLEWKCSLVLVQLCLNKNQGDGSPETCKIVGDKLLILFYTYQILFCLPD